VDPTHVKNNGDLLNGKRVMFKVLEFLCLSAGLLFLGGL